MGAIVPAAPAAAAPPLPKIVVIMGAGSSADFGVPTLRGVFKDPSALAYLRHDNRLHEWLQRVFWEPRGHSYVSSDSSLTVEEMLTLLRDWKREAPDAADLRDFDDMLRRLYVLIYHAVYINKSSSAKHLNGLIDALHRSFSQITWASFNWDCIFEASYWYVKGNNPHLIFNLAGWRNNPFPKNEYLKLHGSVNWWLINGALTYLRWANYAELADKWRELEEGRTHDTPIILEPSAYKYEAALYRDILKPQWDRFYTRLCEADCVLILGYSLPDNDPEARCKLLTAFQINQNCRWAVADPGTETKAKYTRLLGTRRLFTFDMGLAGFGINLENNLRAAFPHVNIVDKPAPPPVAAVPAASVAPSV
jgi:hypothetical protein